MDGVQITIDGRLVARAWERDALTYCFMIALKSIYFLPPLWTGLVRCSQIARNIDRLLLGGLQTLLQKASGGLLPRTRDEADCPEQDLLDSTRNLSPSVGDGIALSSAVGQQGVWSLVSAAFQMDVSLELEPPVGKAAWGREGESKHSSLSSHKPTCKSKGVFL